MGKDEKGKGFLDPSSKTARLYTEASQYIPGGTSRIHYYFRPYPIYAQSGEGSLFRLLMTDESITDYRTSIRKAAPQERFNRLHQNLLEEGVIISKEGLGCLSTPMGEKEVDQFVRALERAVARLRKE